MKYTDIQQMTRTSSYQVDVPWSYLHNHISSLMVKDSIDMEVDLNPDFQRGHIWTESQQIAYIEFKLKGGTGSDIILCNCPGWMGDWQGPYELVDGKQRLTAVERFLKNEIPAFGTYHKDYEGKIPFGVRFKWCVNNLKTKKEVLQWYLEINTGGTPHTDGEIEKVKNMLKVIGVMNNENNERNKSR